MTNSKYITRLKRSEGQLRGIQKMIEEDCDCADIVTQLTAVKSSVECVIKLNKQIGKKVFKIRKTHHIKCLKTLL